VEVSERCLRLELWCLVSLSTIFQLYRGKIIKQRWGRRVRMVVGFTITYVISGYHH
jgi:hypothetical protein